MSKEHLVPFNSRIPEDLHIKFKMIVFKKRESIQNVLISLIEKFVEENAENKKDQN